MLEMMSNISRKYLLVSLILILVCISLSLSYSSFTLANGGHEVTQFLINKLTADITINGVNNDSVSVPANGSITISVVLTSLYNTNTYYKLSTLSNESLLVQYDLSSDPPFGIITAYGTKTISLVLTNSSSNIITTNINIDMGYITNELTDVIVSNGNTAITQTTSVPVELSIIGGTLSRSSVEFSSSNEEVTITPSDGYLITNAYTHCTTGITYSLNSTTFTITDATSSGTCNIVLSQLVEYSGSSVTYNVPINGSYTFQTYGSQGGNTGGLGGYVSGTASLTTTDSLTIDVGGTDGYNGGGASTGSTSYAGGGSSTIKNGSTYLIIAAGGGATGANGTTGGAGGNGTGSGGVSAGAGVGNAGTNGGGGSSSPNYVTSYCARCTVSETNCTSSTSSSSFCTYGCSASLSPGCSSSGTFTYYSSCSCGATQCGNSSTYCYATQVTKTCSCSTSNVSTTSCSGSYISCDSWGYNTTQGKPGSGGSNSTDASITNVTSSSGLRTGNGQITIIFNG